jgi:U4/U6.U5 tri-snRNP component SNU23
MRVERADVTDVKQKLFELKKKSLAGPVIRKSALEEHDQKLKAQEDQKESLKRRLREEADARKRAKVFAEDEDDDNDNDQLVDNDMAAMMGFGGFGSKKK